MIKLPNFGSFQNLEKPGLTSSLVFIERLLIRGEDLICQGQYLALEVDLALVNMLRTERIASELNSSPKSEINQLNDICF